MDLLGSILGKMSAPPAMSEKEKEKKKRERELIKQLEERRRKELERTRYEKQRSQKINLEALNSLHFFNFEAL